MSCPTCANALSETDRACGACGRRSLIPQVTQTRPDPVDETVRRELAAEFVLDRRTRRGERTFTYAGCETGTGRPVAVTVAFKRALREAGVEYQHVSRAAAAAQSLAHPHIVPVHQFGTTGSLLWYAMELVEARTLADILGEGRPLEMRRCLWMVQQIASALQYAHGRGVMHGDLQPATVLVDAEDWVRVADFAVAAALGGAVGSARPRNRAPEVTAERQLAPAADQYALAALVCRCVSAAPASGTGAGTTRKPPDPAFVLDALTGTAGVPANFINALRRALSERPGDRFRTLIEFVTVLDSTDARSLPVLRSPVPTIAPPSPGPRVLRGQAGAPRRWFRAVPPVAAAGLTVAILYLGFRPAPVAPSPPPPAAFPPARSLPPAPARPLPPLPTADPRPRPPAAAHMPGPKPDAGSNTLPSRPSIGARPPAARRTPVAPPRIVPPAIGHVSVNSTPWGRVYIDGRFIGHTPLVHVEVASGVRGVRIVRDGYEAVERAVQVAPGQDLRLTGITLKEVSR